MKKHIIFISSLLILPTVVLAQTSLKHFDMSQFAQCQTAIQKCPKTGPYLDAQCVSTTLSENTFCAQTARLSKETSVSADQIAAKNYGNLTLFSLHYRADGGINYSILTDGQLVDMNIDPVNVDSALAKKYAGEEVFLTIISEPTYVVSASGDRQLIAPIRLTKGCIACTVLETGKVIFHFNTQGQFIASQVEIY